jgi:hypothetical protein
LLTCASLAARRPLFALVLASSRATLAACSRKPPGVSRCVAGPFPVGSMEQHGTVIHDVDLSLTTWLGRFLPADVTVRFASPRADWGDRPLVNGFLYEIREDTGMLVADSQPLRDADGRTTARRPPIRRYRLRYLLTAWTADDSEHSLLAAVLSGAVSHLTIPADCLAGSLVDAGELIPVRCAPASEKAVAPDFYTQFGLPLRTMLDLVVTAPLVPVVQGDLAAVPSEVDLRTSKSDGAPVALPSNGDRPRGRITER